MGAHVLFNNHELCMRVRVKAKSRVEGITGETGPFIKVSVKASPERGKANKRLCEIIAGFFNVPLRNIEIVSGRTKRDKTVMIKGVTENEAVSKLSAVL